MTTPTELADFLRQRRSELRPADVGLPAGARRRVVGMRREEVASQAGMSVNYYTRLEQGRGPQPSQQMLAAIARALRLTLEERDYLYRVAGHPAPDRAKSTSHVSPGLLRVLDRLDNTPAIVLSLLTETLIANRLAVALFGDHSHLTGFARCSVYRWFSDPSARLIYPEADRARHSRAEVANLRAAFGMMGPHSRAGELVQALRSRSPEFEGLWKRHEVARRYEDHKTIVHPELGSIDLDCQALFTEDQTQTLVVLTAPTASPARDKLDLLSVLGTQIFQG